MPVTKALCESIGMNKFLLILGFGLIGFSILGLMGFLPVDTWVYLKNLYNDEGAKFYRVVHGESKDYGYPICLIIGVSIISFWWYRKKRSAL